MMANMADLIVKLDVDAVSPFARGIENDATVIEIRAALTEFRQRHGRLPWHIFATQGRA